MTPEGMRRHAKFKRVDRLFESVIGATIQFVFWWWVVAGPVAFFSWLSTRIIEKASLGLQVAVFIAWGLVLVVALFLMGFPRLRNWLFTRLRDLGSFVPAIYSVTILMVSISDAKAKVAELEKSKAVKAAERREASDLEAQQRIRWAELLSGAERRARLAIHTRGHEHCRAGGRHHRLRRHQCHGRRAVLLPRGRQAPVTGHPRGSDYEQEGVYEPSGGAIVNVERTRARFCG